MDLIHSGGDDGGFIHCARCGGLAAGPCARCRLPVCGDCVVLTEGGAHVWAVCKVCDAKGGRSLRGGWFGVVTYLALPILGLVLALVLLGWLFR